MMITGTCQFGATCWYSHDPGVLTEAIMSGNIAWNYVDRRAVPEFDKIQHDKTKVRVLIFLL